MNLKYELQNIISGVGDYSAENPIQAAAHHLRESKKTGRNAQESERSKEQETKKLIVNCTFYPQNLLSLYYEDNDITDAGQSRG